MHEPKKVAVVGAGAAGMAAAWSLSRYPRDFEITVIEAGPSCGGVACTLDNNGERINYGVQGGAPASHQNTVEFMREFGFEIGDAALDVSFGKGEHNWKNYESKPLQQRLKSEITRFGTVLKWISRLEFFTIFVSIEFVLTLCRFSSDFRHRMVYPLVALFFGTGNATPQVSSAVIARVFLDQSLALFEYDPEHLLNQTPQNIAFDDLEKFYSAVRQRIEGERCRFRMNTRATKISRRHRGRSVLHLEPSPAGWRAGSDQRSGDSTAAVVAAEVTAKAAPPPAGQTEALEFDEVILCCAANVAADLLATDEADAGSLVYGGGETVGLRSWWGMLRSWWERRVLRSVEYFHDLTVTHTDGDYMRRHNEVDGRAIYFIAADKDEPARLEMGFDLTAYQPTLAARRDPRLPASGERIYQTIFLDRQRSAQWTLGEIEPSKIIDKAWWVAFSHTYKHFRHVVPWVWTLQGRMHTWFAGSWTLFNTHDIAISSGLAAAYRLGASYPFGHSTLATATFDTVLGASHLRRRRATEAKGKMA